MPDADIKTCKVVKREGQRGARIAPKGCKVRTDISADGSTTRKNKAGETKIKRVIVENKFFMAVTGTGPNQQSVINGWSQRSTQSKRTYKAQHQILYDTGAMVTLMSRALCERLGIKWKRRTNISHSDIQGVGGTERLKVLHDVVFYVQIDSRSNQWTKVTADIYVQVVDSSTSNLLGVDSIRQIKRLNVKFRN